jgi:Uma2 family endonuclease
MAAPKAASEFPLEPGDCLDQETFHARYEAMPEHVKAELIEGVVYMPSPLKLEHGEVHLEVVSWLTLYKAATLGTRAADNATTILGPFSEPQPDASLFIVPEYGGRTTVNAEGYLVGSPELLAEVSKSSQAYDLHGKRRDYDRAGVQEYVVVLLREQRVVWLVRREGGLVEMEPGPDGIFRSEFFGGLWLDAAALLRCDTLRVHDVLRQGLASPDHARFLQRLKTSG